MKKMSSQRVVAYVVLAVFVVIAAYPFLWMFFCSLKSSAEERIDRWGPPDSFEWSNFQTVLFESSFPKYIFNSLLVTGVSVTLTLVAASLAGFAFARMRFRGRAILFYMFLAGMMIPVHIVLIPLLKTLMLLGAYDTHIGLIASYVGFSLPISVFILRGFFEAVPHELEEAARMDGCSAAGVFWYVMLPLARPAIATVLIFNFVTLWNEFIIANTLLLSTATRTIPLGLWDFQGEYGSNVPVMCAALAISVLPMLVLYAFAQKHIIRGLTAGALKG